MFTPAGKKEKINEIGANLVSGVETGLEREALGLAGQAVIAGWEQVCHTAEEILEKAKNVTGRAELKLYSMYFDFQRLNREGLTFRQWQSLVSLVMVAGMIIAACNPIEGNENPTYRLPSPEVTVYSATVSALPTETFSVIKSTLTKEILPVGVCAASTSAMREQGDVTEMLPEPEDWSVTEKQKIVDGGGNPIYEAVSLISSRLRSSGYEVAGVAVGGQEVGGVVVVPVDANGNYIYATEKDALGNFVASGRLDGNGLIEKGEGISVPQPPRGELKVWMQGETGGGSCAYYVAMVDNVVKGKFDPLLRRWEMDEKLEPIFENAEVQLSVDPQNPTPVEWVQLFDADTRFFNPYWKGFDGEPEPWGEIPRWENPTTQRLGINQMSVVILRKNIELVGFVTSKSFDEKDYYFIVQAVRSNDGSVSYWKMPVDLEEGNFVISDVQNLKKVSTPMVAMSTRVECPVWTTNLPCEFNQDLLDAMEEFLRTGNLPPVLSEYPLMISGSY